MLVRNAGTSGPCALLCPRPTNARVVTLVVSRKLENGSNECEPDHWTERGRAASVSNLDVTDRPRRSVTSLAVTQQVTRRLHSRATRGFGLLRILVVLALVAFWPGVIGCRTVPVPELSPAQPHLKVLTWNVNCASQAKGLAIQKMLDADPDVVCLQETDPAWCQALEAALAERYTHRLLLPYTGVAGISILSRYEILESGVLAPEAGWMPSLWADVQTPIGLVRVVNVHLRPSLSERGSVSLPGYYRARSVRVEELCGFMRDMPEDRPLIVAGDFNEGDHGRATEWMHREGFEDALLAFDRSTPTWRWRVGFIPISARFDRVLFRHSLGCTGARVIDSDVSDHRPVLAAFCSAE